MIAHLDAAVLDNVEEHIHQPITCALRLDKTGPDAGRIGPRTHRGKLPLDTLVSHPFGSAIRLSDEDLRQFRIRQLLGDTYQVESPRYESKGQQRTLSEATLRFLMDEFRLAHVHQPPVGEPQCRNNRQSQKG